MNYGRIHKTDIANGPGVRVSLFVSGCRNRCKGCFNPEAWNFNYGQEYDGINTANEIVKSLTPDYISGLTILGGDPMEPENIYEITNLCYIVKLLFPNKSIWLYTGYMWEDIEDREIKEYIDVLVDGPFVEDLKDISLQFRGSSNQRIIDVSATRISGTIVLWEG